METNSQDQLSVFFLSQGEQSADSVMARLTHFLGGAQRSLDFALYDMRLSDVFKQRTGQGIAGTG